MGPPLYYCLSQHFVQAEHHCKVRSVKAVTKLSQQAVLFYTAHIISRGNSYGTQTFWCCAKRR